jgi:hypothetical protein
MSRNQQLNSLHNSRRFQKAMANLENLAADFGRKDAADERKRNEAMARTVAALVLVMPEDGRTVLFAQLEMVAKKSDRRWISTHPARPDAVDDMLAEAQSDGGEDAREVAPAALARNAAVEAGDMAAQ